MPFTLEKRGDLKYFVPDNIKNEKTPAIFTTRLGGVSGEDISAPFYSLNLGSKNNKYDKAENIEQNYKIVADVLGFSVNNIIYAHQKHTDNILICDKDFLEKHRNNMLPLPDDCVYDAMITDIPGVLLAARTADCVPVLLWDEENNIIGAAHCGWRGTLSRLQAKTVLKMREVYGASPCSLKIAIGPCISRCCYEVSDDFYESFVNTLGERIKIHFDEKGKGKYMCDLKSINKMLLLDLLPEENIEISQNCTYCEKELFFSYRRQGQHTGAHAAFIGIKE